MSRGTQQLSWPAQSVEWGAVGFGKIIEEQLQLEGMGRGLSENTQYWGGGQGTVHDLVQPLIILSYM